MLKNIDKYPNIVIFGAGGGHIFRWLMQQYYGRVSAIIDNDKNKWGKDIMGKRVEAPSYLFHFSKEDTVVVLSLYNHWETIQQQIKDLGWENNFIIARKELDSVNSFEFALFEKEIEISNLSPTFLNVELSGICNCRCVYCPFHGVQNIKEGQKSLMSWTTLKEVVSQIKNIPTIKKLSTVGNGEVFVHPEWYEMVKYILDETHIRAINMYTNGMLLNESNIRKILSLDVDELELEISIDGRTPEENDFYRMGSKYKTIKDNIERLCSIEQEVGRKIKLTITNCYPLKDEELEKIGNKLDLHYAEVPEYLKRDFPQITSVSKNTYVCKRKHDKGLNDLKAVKVQYPEGYSRRCTNLFCRMAINNRGELLRCSCGYAGIEGIGSVYEHELFKLWKNDIQMNLAREHFVKGDVAPDFCEGCIGSGIGEYYLMLE